MAAGTVTKRALHPTRNDLGESARAEIVEHLNQRLADCIDLGLQSKQAHWNVKGPSFIALHKLFDDVAEAAEEYVDLLAERATALGGTAEGTVQAVGRGSTLPAYPLDIVKGRDHLQAMAVALSTFGKLVRQGIETAIRLGDQDTADLFTEISRGIDKHLWLVEAHLQAEG